MELCISSFALWLCLITKHIKYFLKYHKICLKGLSVNWNNLLDSSAFRKALNWKYFMIVLTRKRWNGRALRREIFTKGKNRLNGRRTKTHIGLLLKSCFFSKCTIVCEILLFFVILCFLGDEVSAFLRHLSSRDLYILCDIVDTG